MADANGESTRRPGNAVRVASTRCSIAGRCSASGAGAAQHELDRLGARDAELLREPLARLHRLGAGQLLARCERVADQDHEREGPGQRHDPRRQHDVPAAVDEGGETLHGRGRCSSAAGASGRCRRRSPMTIRCQAPFRQHDASSSRSVTVRSGRHAPDAARPSARRAECHVGVTTWRKGAWHLSAAGVDGVRPRSPPPRTAAATRPSRRRSCRAPRPTAPTPRTRGASAPPGRCRRPWP